MNYGHSHAITFAFAMVPYILVSWGYTELTGGNTKTFWTALGLLLGFRLFFGMIETLGGILAWRLHGKKVMIEKMLDVLKTNKFPKRFYSHDDILGYLARIENSEELSPSIKSAAKQLESLLEMFENLGILAGARMYSATEAALESYSPRRSAPVLTFSKEN